MNTTNTIKQDCQILVANDCHENLELVHCLLRNWGYKSCSATTAKLALSKVRLENYKLVIVDKMLPDMTGTHLANRIKMINRQLPVLCLNWGAAPHVCDHNCEHECTTMRPQKFKEVVKDAVYNKVKYDIVHI